MKTRTRSHIALVLVAALAVLLSTGCYTVLPGQPAPAPAPVVQGQQGQAPQPQQGQAPAPVPQDQVQQGQIPQPQQGQNPPPQQQGPVPAPIPQGQVPQGQAPQPGPVPGPIPQGQVPQGQAPQQQGPVPGPMPQGQVPQGQAPQQGPVPGPNNPGQNTSGQNTSGQTGGQVQQGGGGSQAMPTVKMLQVDLQATDMYKDDGNFLHIGIKNNSSNSGNMGFSVSCTGQHYTAPSASKTTLKYSASSLNYPFNANQERWTNTNIKLDKGTGFYELTCTISAPSDTNQGNNTVTKKLTITP